MRLDPNIHPIQNLVFTRPRISGIEHEYGILIEGPNKRFRNEGFSLTRDNVFNTNGSRTYVDSGQHPEYASPETKDPLSFVLYDKAGDILMPKIMKLNDNDKNFWLFKHNTDGQENYYSAHENYCINRENLDSRSNKKFRRGIQNMYRRLTPFFVTRQIMVGNGYIDPSGKFCLSQRSSSIMANISEETMKNRGIFNLRMESHANNNLYSRLHLITGDSSLSDPTIFLKNGTTSLVLDLYEDGHLKPIEFKNDPVKIIKSVSEDIDFREKYLIQDEGHLSAKEIQEIYLNKAIEKYAGRDTGTDEILKRWEHTITHIDEENKKIDMQIDWRIKEKYLFDYSEKNGGTYGDARQRQIDLQFGCLNNGKGIHKLLEKKGRIETFFSEDQISYATRNPPKGTRASFRGKAMKAKEEKGKNINFESSNWEKIIIEGVRYNLDDPYNEYSHLERLLK